MKKEWTGVAYHYEEGPIVLIKFNGQSCQFELWERGNGRTHRCAISLIGDGRYDIYTQVTPEMYDMAYTFAVDNFNLGEDDA